MHRQVLLGLCIRHAALLDQPHSLKLELACKLPPLHDPPPVPLKHLTRCLRNRVQATQPNLMRADSIKTTRNALNPISRISALTLGPIFLNLAIISAASSESTIDVATDSQASVKSRSSVNIAVSFNHAPDQRMMHLLNANALACGY